MWNRVSETLSDGFTVLLVKTITGHPMETGYLAVPCQTVRDLGAGWIPSGTVRMTHRRVDMICHFLIQSPVSVQLMPTCKA